MQKCDTGSHTSEAPIACPMKSRFLPSFLGFLGAYVIVILALSRQGSEIFEHLHLFIDTGNGILSLMLVMFLVAMQYNLDSHTRGRLIIGFGLAAFTEILHAMVGIEWSGVMSWVQASSNQIRPATWPPSTYVLPIALAWMLWLDQRKLMLSMSRFALGMTGVTCALIAVSWLLPKYVDTGILGIQRPTQVPLLLLWMAVIVQCWRLRARHPLFEGLAWLGVMLFLSDLCMLYSTSPHEKFTMMAHSGKLLAYLMLHEIQTRIAAADSIARSLAETEIQQLAFFDPLTGLANRRLLMDRLGHAQAASARSARMGALLLLDLDHFKTLNDTLGHDMGDLLLKQVAARLLSSVREGDTVARLGGDEFVVVLEELPPDEFEAAALARHVGEKIHATLTEPYQLKDRIYRSTPSIGMTLFSGHDASLDDLIQQADIAMYQAKSAGRNGLCFFDPQMQTRLAEQSSLEAGLRNALLLEQFELHYQIQVDDNKRALGAEALIRWRHPTKGLVMPLQFIPLAEETDLILPIGQWVLETACAQIRSWQQSPVTSALTLSVNVSAKQFHQTGFAEQVREAVSRHAIAPNRLKLELTESLLIGNADKTIQTLQALSHIGVGLSLDDFGTGYSSLQYLKQLPLEQVKIDRSFVRDLSTDAFDRAIVHTIITMADSMDLNAIAEGVETEEQLELLRKNGCRHFQGYLFGQPMPLAQFEASLPSHGLDSGMASGSPAMPTA